MASDQMTMTKQQANSILSSAKFKSVHSRNEIPSKWAQAMNLDKFSDIGGPFSAGCTGTESHSRLMEAAVSEPYGFAMIEFGGIAHFFEFRLFKQENGSIKQVYNESVLPPRISEIRKTLGIQQTSI